MAVDAFSGTSALADQVVSAYDRSAYFALRDNAVFDQFAKVKPGNVTSPGSSVAFLFWGDLTAATATLSETVDTDAVALSDSLVTVTPQEYGNAVLLSIKVRSTSFALGFDSDVANVVAYNLLDSLETVAEIALTAGGTEAYHSGATGQNQLITGTDVMTMNEIRRQVATARKASVQPFAGERFAAVMNPDVAYDLMIDTATGGWGNFHIRQDNEPWYNGQVGRAAGVDFIESPRARINLTGGTGATDDTYTTYIFGNESFAKAEVIPPHIVPGPVTDKLMRFMPLGWHAYMAYSVLRTASLRRLLTASNLGGT